MPRRSFVSIASLVLVAPHALAEHAHSDDAPASQESAPQAASRPNYDVLVLNGHSLEGEIVSESDDHVTIRVTIGGLNAEMDYPRSAVQEIRLGAGAPIPPAPPPPPPKSPLPPTYFTIAPPDAAITGGVYWITLTGKLGQEISQTPIRDAFRDAKQFQPDVIVIEVNNTPLDRPPAADAGQGYSGTDEFYRAERLFVIPVDEVPSEWSEPPRIVYWVRNAIGALCLLPLTCKEVYFAPDGRLGGMEEFPPPRPHRIGHQLPLHRQHMVGWINHSDFPQPEALTRGLVTRRFSLSVRIEDGKPALFEGPPTNPNELALTDDGEGPNADTPEQIAAGTGNDLLTLNAETAQLIGVSKGTVATREDLLAAIGLEGAHIIDGRADLIMKQWSEGVENAHAQLVPLIAEYKAIRIEGDYDQRKAARAAAITCAEQIKSIANRWNEGLDPFRLHDAGLPADSNGIDLARLQHAIDRLRLEQSLDRRE